MTTLPELLAARYGKNAPRIHADLNSTLETQLTHKSVRKFLDTPVTDDQLRLIVAAAQSASTSSSMQAWSIVVVRDAQKRARIAEAIGAAGEFQQVAPVFLVWVVDFARNMSVLEAQGGTENNVGFLENTIVGFTDIGIASQNALLAAESMGLGGVYAGSLRNNIEAVVRELNLPEYVFPALGLAIGTPNPTEGTGVKPRLPQSAVLHIDEYDPDAWDAACHAYDPEFAEYYAGQGVPSASWMRTVAKRLGRTSLLNGREHLREHLAKQGLESK